jgi:hypothetical protein
VTFGCVSLSHSFPAKIALLPVNGAMPLRYECDTRGQNRAISGGFPVASGGGPWEQSEPIAIEESAQFE